VHFISKKRINFQFRSSFLFFIEFGFYRASFKEKIIKYGPQHCAITLQNRTLFLTDFLTESTTNWDRICFFWPKTIDRKNVGQNLIVTNSSQLLTEWQSVKNNFDGLFDRKNRSKKFSDWFSNGKNRSKTLLQPNFDRKNSVRKKFRLNFRPKFRSQKGVTFENPYAWLFWPKILRPKSVTNKKIWPISVEISVRMH